LGINMRSSTLRAAIDRPPADMKTARQTMLFLLLYATYATAVATILMRAADSWSDTQAETNTLSARRAQVPPSRVEVDIISSDVTNPFTIRCVTTRDRIASDVLEVQSIDDLDSLEQNLGCQAGWSS
jgi:hypothetical protein